MYLRLYEEIRFSSNSETESLRAIASIMTAFPPWSVQITQFGFRSRLRAFWDLGPVLKYITRFNHSPQMIMTWGLPSLRTVAIQKLRFLFSLYSAHFQLSRPFFPWSGVNPGDASLLAVGSGRLVFWAMRSFVFKGVGALAMNYKGADRIYPECRNKITSPSLTMYSLPSRRTWPFSRAAAKLPAASRSSQKTTSALMKFFSISL